MLFPFLFPFIFDILILFETARNRRPAGRTKELEQTMKVAIFTETYFPYISGVVTHIQTLRDALVEQGHEVLIITASPKYKRHTLKDGVLYCPALTLKRIYGASLASPLNQERFDIVKKFDPDVCHIHTEFSIGIFGRLTARKLKKPTVYTLHTMYDDYLFYIAPNKAGQDMVKPAAHLYIRKMATSATEVIGPSVKVVEFLRRCKVDRHINIVPNTVDLSDFLSENVAQSDVQAIREKLGIRPEDVAMCFVGRLGKEKSLDVLIDLLAKQCWGDKRYKLFIIGDGPEKERLEAQAQRLGITDQVKLLGRIEHGDLPPYYQACDLFTTASLSEINSISMLEAMASGLYVIQRLDIYNKNQIVEGENGHTFTKPEEFGALVREESSFTPEQRLARRQRVTAYSQKYGKKEFVSGILNVYQRAIAEYKNKKK